MPPALGTILLTWQHGQVLLQRHETPFVDDGMNKPKSYEVRNRSVKALPDPICQLQIPVGTAGPHLPAPHPIGNAGPQPRAPDLSGQRRTSTASSRSQWATPVLNRELQIPVGNAGPQPRAPDPSGQRRTSTASSRSQWALPDLKAR
eukprot:s805_g14.t2